MIMVNKDITDIIIFRSCDFGGVHLGQRRFDTVKDLVGEVLSSELLKADRLKPVRPSTPLTPKVKGKDPKTRFAP